MINEYENLLRNIILNFLGENAEVYKISPDRIDKWKDKKKEDDGRNKGLKETRIIYYSDFYDLETIINKNWEIFSPLFEDKKRFNTFFKEVYNFRNTVAHGRKLTKSQLYLLEGILLDLNNLQTIYHNKNNMVDDFFISINKISDNLGNVWTKERRTTIQPTLRVGDEYEILIEANDPKDREIEYEVRTLDGRLIIKQKNNRFNFRIGENLICRSSSLLIRARTLNSDYENETNVTALLTVLPNVK
ncbi:MAG: hypothetical protein LBV43_11025 [Prevotella sp.]|jgi:hypothetical protein|nr:hypothetical protein [Prevotella sp.]